MSAPVIPPTHASATFATLVRNPRARDYRQKSDFRLICGSSQIGEVHFAPGDTMAGRHCSLSLGRSALLHGRVVNVTLPGPPRHGLEGRALEEFEDPAPGRHGRLALLTPTLMTRLRSGP